MNRWLAYLLPLVALGSQSWATIPSFGECDRSFSHEQLLRDVPSDSWVQVAQEFLAALKERRPAVFPAHVDGMSLIPPKILERLEARAHPVDARGKPRGIHQIDEIESVRLETWHDRDFVIAIQFRMDGKAAIHMEGTFPDEYFIWRNYLRKSLQTGIIYAFNLRQLPKALPKRVDPFDQVRRNDFHFSRSLAEYDEAFKGRLRARLRRLSNSGELWIDMGAGSAAAQLTFLRRRLARSGSRSTPRVVALSYKYPGSAASLARLNESYKEHFEYVEGKQGPTGIRRLEMADLITDVMGIFTYSENKTEVFKAYLSRLKPGGILMVQSCDAYPDQFRKIAEQNSEFNYEEIDDGTFIVTRR